MLTNAAEVVVVVHGLAYREREEVVLGAVRGERGLGGRGPGDEQRNGRGRADEHSMDQHVPLAFFGPAGESTTRRPASTPPVGSTPLFSDGRRRRLKHPASSADDLAA